MLSMEELPQVFKQCSRLTPKSDEILGAPSPDEVSEMEVKLSRYLSEIYEAGKIGMPVLPPPITYARQYVK
jgi:hypothetical protein